MRPTEILMNEHRVIEQVLGCLETMVARAERGDEPLDPEAGREMIAFFRTFADTCHHGKEESQLFPLMEQRGMSPDEGPTHVMRLEHDQGRALIGRMDDALSELERPAARDAFVAAARQYALLLRAHIEKEDTCLFPMADRMLEPAAEAELLDRFGRVEHDELGPGVHREQIAVADRLAERYGVSKAELPSEAVCGCGHAHD